MKDYLLGLDVWEGSLDIDEAEIEAAGVAYLAIRLNSIYGSTHLDENFTQQWTQAERFRRWPYYVYNPSLSGPANAEWMGDNLPPGVKRVGIDIEVKRAGYAPKEYAGEVRRFLALVKRCWRPVVYTGQWFLTVLAYWPTDLDYWWGRYPFVMYPKNSITITWDELKAMIEKLIWSPGDAPGPVAVWQCSGDRLKLPGCRGRAVDVNLTRMTLPELDAWTGDTPAPRSWLFPLYDWAKEKGYAGPGPAEII